jgi:signal transduction histidine kinase
LQLIGLVAGIDSLGRELSPPHLSIAFRHRNVPADNRRGHRAVLVPGRARGAGNAVKHSDARHVWVELAGEPPGVALTITDDGKGFDDGVPNAGLGLISMRERVESVGGVLEIHTTPGDGTRLRVTVPIQASESAAAGRA